MGFRTLAALVLFAFLLASANACSTSSDSTASDSTDETPAGPATTLDPVDEQATATTVPPTNKAPEPETTTATGPQDPGSHDSESNDPEQDKLDPADTNSAVVTGPGTGPFVALTPVGPDDSGDDVEALQRRLAELGFAPGAPDGDYGRRTTRAVEAFQFLMDLEPTGEADAETAAALTAYRYSGIVLVGGDESAEVEALQKKLASGPFDPGPADGKYGTGTVQAVWALEKLADFPVDGNWGPLDAKAWEMLMSGEIGRPEKSHDQRWVEVDLAKQIMKVYDPGSTMPTLISHTSSGSGVPWKNEEHSGSSVTPLGDFHINRRVNGWRESSLDIGRLYNPLYFNGGIAFHGAQSVPLYPASHGCIRLPMHVADYLPDELPNGTPVHVLRST